MQAKKFIPLLILLIQNITASSQVTNDSLFNELERLKRKNIQLKNINNKIQQINDSLTRVEVLETCSTEPERCGVVVTASVTMVKIINGPFYGDTILIATACQKTNYIAGNIYSVEITQGPSFSVHLCSGKIYNRNWNFELDKNKQLIVFGILMKLSK